MFKVGEKVLILATGEVMTVKAVWDKTVEVGLADTDGSFINVWKKECVPYSTGISIEDRVPTSNDTDDKDQVFMRFEDGEWHCFVFFPDEKRPLKEEGVTHWMHTPTWHWKGKLHPHCHRCERYSQRSFFGYRFKPKCRNGYNPTRPFRIDGTPCHLTKK